MGFKVNKKSPKGDGKKLYLSVKEAVKYSGLSEYAIRKLIANKDIPYLEAGRKFLIDRIGLKNHLNNISNHHLSL